MQCGTVMRPSVLFKKKWKYITMLSLYPGYCFIRILWERRISEKTLYPWVILAECNLSASGRRCVPCWSAGSRAGKGEKLCRSKVEPDKAINSAVDLFFSISCATFCAPAWYIEWSWMRILFRLQSKHQHSYNSYLAVATWVSMAVTLIWNSVWWCHQSGLQDFSRLQRQLSV